MLGRYDDVIRWRNSLGFGTQRADHSGISNCVFSCQDFVRSIVPSAVLESDIWAFPSKSTSQMRWVELGMGSVSPLQTTRGSGECGEPACGVREAPTRVFPPNRLRDLGSVVSLLRDPGSPKQGVHSQPTRGSEDCCEPPAGSGSPNQSVLSQPTRGSG